MSDPGKKWIGRLQAFVVIIILLIGWFSCVLGAAWGLDWFGPIVVTILVVLHVFYSRSWRRDLALMIVLGLVGALVESLHAATGWITFKGQGTSWWVPPWVWALWAHYGTMRHASLRWLFGRPLLAAISGALFAPAVYAAGAAFGAIVLAPPAWRSLALVSLVWAVIVPLASFLSWRGTPLER